MSGLVVNILRRTRVCNASQTFSECSLSFLNVRKNPYSTSAVIDKHEAAAKKLADENKKKARDSVKITLLGKNNTLSITSLEEAQKLSRRRDMKLVKVEDFDLKTQRAVYKLMTTAELLAEDGPEKKSTNARKHEKLLNIGSRIAEHDLQSRLKNISKWLHKGNEVRILIHGTNASDPGILNVFNAIDTLVNEIGGRLVQKVNKGGNMKFCILPPSPESELGGKNS